MAVRIRCINKDGGNHDNPHEAISHYGWVSDTDSSTRTSTREVMVDFLKNKGGKAYVQGTQGNKAFCQVRKSAAGTEFLQTVADNTYTDNLLSLPECK